MPKPKHSIFEVEKITSEAVTIRDIGHDKGRPTVTNDAEAVVRSVCELGLLRPGRRLLYYDSAGDLAEILTRDGQFVGFAPGQCPDAPEGEPCDYEPDLEYDPSGQTLSCVRCGCAEPPALRDEPVAEVWGKAGVAFNKPTLIHILNPIDPHINYGEWNVTDPKGKAIASFKGEVIHIRCGQVGLFIGPVMPERGACPIRFVQYQPEE